MAIVIGLQLKLFLYMEATPPPLLVVRGVLKNERSGGRSSEKDVESPAVTQVSVKNKKSRSWVVIKSCSKNVFSLMDLVLKRAICRLTAGEGDVVVRVRRRRWVGSILRFGW